MKVDLSIQSYNKPESLIYALFCLHRVSKDLIDTVWINDDCSNPGVVDKYKELEQSGALYPWKIKIRVNEKRGGWWLAFVKGIRPSYQTRFFRLKRFLWNFYKTGGVYSIENDIRYQWALNNTDKRYVFIMHDDIFFKQDIIRLYLNEILGNNAEQAISKAIVGDLGQCWRCKHSDICSPNLILSGYRPDNLWPLTQRGGEKHKWACRINEWSCLVDTHVAKEIMKLDKIYFGNYDDDGDVAAYWFSRVVQRGYSFGDPLPTKELRDKFYLHWEDGVTGHSAWVDQGDGKNKYQPQVFKQRVNDEFGYEIRG
jgi:hypothetical protein